MIDKTKIQIGSDIEVFFKDKFTGEYKSAIGLVGGSKEHPKPLEKPQCCVQEDNVALEYNVPPVSLNEASEMWNNIDYVLSTVKKTLPEELEIECCASARFSIDQLNNPKAQEFGCEPDFNAWDGGMPNPSPRSDTNLRSCGGHIHISYPNADMETSLKLVRIFDLFLGVPSVLSDLDSDRRVLYGKAGAHRIKFWGTESGFEYRTLSNWWTKSQDSVEWLFNQISLALDFFNEGKDVLEFENDIIEAINNSNPETAHKLCAVLNIEHYAEKVSA